ncbi:DUF1015 domain-containing protein [Geobacter sp. DSM 9736]|uniref:DUF1015 domain-containing protein n=1 Tax=Geobacter sp. DSM 9736 TaxID=1277350 RepID=UPI000B501664|nr:DUF1015 family protein [Geobacter sp. DSM 9736]SNB44999.1 Uncharacterized conserved protein, DUF1015 family [Geobacter sp. DSM 9736]
MALIKPFRALRPASDLAERVAALPYDVMNVEEAQMMAAGNPYSFLHISRPEIDLPSEVDVHSEPVYVKGHENLMHFMKNRVLIQDQHDCYYVYRQKMGEIVQTGLVACASVDDYQSGVIKKHELTRADKEEDRVMHIDRLDANDEPVFYTYRHDARIAALVAEVTRGEAVYDFTTDDGVEHALWVIDKTDAIADLTALFAAIPVLYVADGHHRSAAASRVRDLRMKANPHHTGGEEYNFFLTVIFPDDEMNIMPYNRAVKDLNGLSPEQFIAGVSEQFEIAPVAGPFQPERTHQFCMVMNGKWFELRARQGSFNPDDAVSRLDVSILQNNLLSPILGIHNPRTDQRIHFVGGIRGLAELERLVAGGEYQVAFALHPTSLDELMALADEGKIMPPKSTWFEPKLRSGLFVHLLS